MVDERSVYGPGRGPAALFHESGGQASDNTPAPIPYPPAASRQIPSEDVRNHVTLVLFPSRKRKGLNRAYIFQQPTFNLLLGNPFC